MSSIQSSKNLVNSSDAARGASSAQPSTKTYTGTAKDLLVKAMDSRGAVKLAGALLALAAPRVAAAARPAPEAVCTEGFSASNGTQAFGATGPCSDVATYMHEFSLCNIKQNASALGEAVVKVSNVTVTLLTDAANSAVFGSDYGGNPGGPNRTSAQTANICLNNGLVYAGQSHIKTSTGAVVGLAVGLGGAALVATAIIGACLYRAHTRRQQAQRAAEVTPTAANATVELTAVTPASLPDPAHGGA